MCHIGAQWGDRPSVKQRNVFASWGFGGFGFFSNLQRFERRRDDPQRDSPLLTKLRRQGKIHTIRHLNAH